MYIECRTGELSRLARIGRVGPSKSRRTPYCGNQRLRRLPPPGARSRGQPLTDRRPQPVDRAALPVPLANPLRDGVASVADGLGCHRDGFASWDRLRRLLSVSGFGR